MKKIISKLNSISFTLIMHFIIVGFVPTIIIVFIGLNSAEKVFSQELEKNFSQYVQSKEVQINTFLGLTESLSRDLASSCFVADKLSNKGVDDIDDINESTEDVGGIEGIENAITKDVDQQLSEYISSKKNIWKDFLSEVNIADPSGKIVFSTLEDAIGQEDNDLVAYFNSTNKSIEDLIKTEIIEKKEFNNEKVVKVSIPVVSLDNDQRIGFISAFYDMKLLEKYISGLSKNENNINLNQSESIETYIVDSRGKIFVSSFGNVDKKNYFEKISLNSYPVAECIQKQKDISGVYESYDKREVIGASICFPNKGWTLISELDFAVANSGMEFLEKLMFISVPIIFVFLLIIVYVLTLRFSAPIKKLTETAALISSGNFGVVAAVKEKNEIGELAMAFNGMAEKLRKYYSYLEEEVKKRTSQLSEKVEETENAKKAMMNILEDVEEEKKKAENLAKDLEKFMLAVENSWELIIITDVDGVILYANRALERITKFKISEVLGKKAGNEKLWGGLESKEFYEKLWKTIKIDKKPFIGEIRNKRKNGDNYIGLVNISPILDKEGNIMFFVAIQRDITLEKDIDRTKTEFVSLASHQLRTPLTSINWYLEMILDGDAGKINKKQEEYLREAKDGSQRMADLVTALLNVSRLELGTFVVEPEPTDILEMSESVLRELRLQTKERKIKVETQYDKELPEIKVDPKLMRIVFQNLFSNAIKYNSEKGKLEVIVKCDKNNIRIEVADTGYGIPEHQKDKIFSKLFRADNVREAVTDGTGLGLYIVKSIIEQTGGEIWFESKENKGTRFFVTLPKSGMKERSGVKALDVK
ncbi:MAG: signal transduction histidine kinase [uncultured bacterium]|nr:MAG: signal transduction histidine kinase [uncultured bacterium]